MQRLTRARAADDVIALETVSADKEIVALALRAGRRRRLWDVCQVPDYRKISGQNHAELVATIYKFLMGPEERIPRGLVRQAGRVRRPHRRRHRHARQPHRPHPDVDVRVQSRRLAQGPRALAGAHARDRGQLSDALHECLTQRFVDRRTSALMKGMRDKDELHAEIAEDGAIHVENHYVGRLQGFRFSPDAGGRGHPRQGHAQCRRRRCWRASCRMRARRVAAAQPDAFQLTRAARILWKDEEIARLEATRGSAASRRSPCSPTSICRRPTAKRCRRGSRLGSPQTIAEKLKPLVEIGKAEDVAGPRPRHRLPPARRTSAS